jgi:hypothetical protein
MSKLKLYKRLEAEVIHLDKSSDPNLSEKIRVVMDYIWRERLSSFEKVELIAREQVKDHSFEDTGFGD